jgi:hypothetical protein
MDEMEDFESMSEEQLQQMIDEGKKTMKDTLAKFDKCNVEKKTSPVTKKASPIKRSTNTLQSLSPQAPAKKTFSPLKKPPRTYK